MKDREKEIEIIKTQIYLTKSDNASKLTMIQSKDTHLNEINI
jgi:hypothetical protein